MLVIMMMINDDFLQMTWGMLPYIAVSLGGNWGGWSRELDLDDQDHDDDDDVDDDVDNRDDNDGDDDDADVGNNGDDYDVV